MCETVGMLYIIQYMRVMHSNEKLMNLSWGVVGGSTAEDGWSSGFRAWCQGEADCHSW